MSICMDCRKGADTCDWLFRLRPIPGWHAKKVRCGNFVTYEVMRCPNYEPNRPYQRKRRTRKELAADERLAFHKLAVSEVVKHGDGLPD